MPRGLLISERARALGEQRLRAFADVRVVVVGPDDVSGDLSQVQVALLSADVYPELMDRFMAAADGAPALEWLHVFTAGVDHRWFDALRRRGVRVTTSSGVAAVAIAHTVALLILALSRGLDRWFDAQRRREWAPHDVRDLTGLTLGVVGMGSIGREVARLGSALGLRVIGLRRTPSGDEPCETWGRDRLPELLATADYLVLALPRSTETERLLDSAALGLMKPTACVVNVGRGSTVDEAALIEALRTRRIAGAALDVFEAEPLSTASPLWDLPNVIVTPHSGGHTGTNEAKVLELFFDNLGRFGDGRPLRNEVD